MRKRRDLEVFSLSFLDCICCGFGAIILLFILSMGATRVEEKESREDLERVLKQMLAALNTVEVEKKELSIDLTIKEDQLTKIYTEITDLEGIIAKLTEQIQNEVNGKKALLVQLEQIEPEIAATQTEIDIPQLDATTPIGVPVESNYVCFVMDTSGSMRDPASEQIWSYVIRKFDEVVSAYPQVKGIQFLDADGRFMIGRAGEWMPDTPEVRRLIRDVVRRYPIFSNSNPVPGIKRAIRTLHDEKDPDMKMGIYVFGDEFAVGTSDPVLREIDEMNPLGPDGKRPVRINGVGFPNLLRAGFSLGQSGVKFANLMRELAQRHGGAFIAVTE